MQDQPDIQGFAHELRWARRQDGDPSLREVRRLMDHSYSISSISRALAGKSFPRWDFTKKFLRACHVSEEEISGTWHARWIAVAGERSPIPGGALNGETPAPPAHAGNECAQCGALVINQVRHQAWHAAYTPREPARAASQQLKTDSTATTHALRSLPG